MTILFGSPPRIFAKKDYMILLLLCSASLHVKKLSQIFLYYYIVHVISCAKGSIIALISLLLETAIFKNDMLDVFPNHNS